MADTNPGKRISLRGIPAYAVLFLVFAHSVSATKIPSPHFDMNFPDRWKIQIDELPDEPEKDTSLVFSLSSIRWIHYKSAADLSKFSDLQEQVLKTFLSPTLLDSTSRTLGGFQVMVKTFSYPLDEVNLPEIETGYFRFYRVFSNQGNMVLMLSTLEPISPTVKEDIEKAIAGTVFKVGGLAIGSRPSLDARFRLKDGVLSAGEGVKILDLRAYRMDGTREPHVTRLDARTWALPEPADLLFLRMITSKGSFSVRGEILIGR